MELSLAFIASKLRRRYPVSLRGADGFSRQIDNPRHIAASPKFKTVRLFVPAKLAGSDRRILPIVRSDAKDAEEISAHVDGIVWIGNCEPPKDVNVLWIATTADTLALADDILNIFEEMNDWTEQVTNMLLAHRPVPNVIAKLAASGDLALINSKQRTWLYEPAEGMTYNMPFVSKAIALKGGIYGYVFIIERMPGYVSSRPTCSTACRRAPPASATPSSSCARAWPVTASRTKSAWSS